MLALLDANDPAHHECVELVERLDEPLALVAPTLVEVNYWIRKKLSPGVWTALVEDISIGAYHLEHLTAQDLVRCAELETQYADSDLGLVDAALITVCERLGETKVATLDRRHFGMVRPAHCATLELLPSQ